MIEGDSFQVTLEKTLRIPGNPGLLCITYEAPTFDDTATGSMRDALEAALVDPAGRPLTFNIQGQAGVAPASSSGSILPAIPDAFFNHSDGKTPFSAPGSVSVLSPSPGFWKRILPSAMRTARNLFSARGKKTLNPQLATIYANVSFLPAGSSARLILRLVNNDRDRATHVRITEVKFKPSDPTLNLAGSQQPALSLLLAQETSTSAAQPADITSSSLPSFGSGSVAPKIGHSSAGTLTIHSPFDNSNVTPGTVLLTGEALVKGGGSNPASGLITFEDIPGATPSEGLTINNQFLATHGVSFGLEGGGSPVLASVGAPLTAFLGPPEHKTPDTPAPGQNVGSFFLTDDGVLGGSPRPLLIRYANPVQAASGNIIDIDHIEAWAIEARDAAGAILETVRLNPSSPNAGDGLATPWYFSHATANIASIRIRYDGGGAGIGLAFDNFSPASISLPNRIVTVTINGHAVDALDAAGNFFSAVQIDPGQNVFEVLATDSFGQTTSNSVTVYGVTFPSNFSGLSVVSASAQPDYGRTSFNEHTNTLYADVALRNAGTYPIRRPFYVGVTNISDPTVRLLGADGVSPDGGIPYYNFTATLDTGLLNTGALSLARTLAFYNPNHVQFAYSLAVLGQANQAPYFTSTPLLEGVPDRAYSYATMATDQDGDPLTYSLLAFPNGMTINAASGVVSWIPTTSHLGNHDVRIRAVDGKGGTAEQNYVLNVITAPSNRPPYFVSTPVTLATVSQAKGDYEYLAVAIDRDGDELDFRLEVFPTGMRIDPAKGLIRWAPTEGDIGDHDVVLKVSDGHGGTATQSYQACVMPTARGQCVPPPSNMVNWWDGENKTNDIQGGNNGTLQNGADFAAGMVGQAFSFDGTDDQVTVAPFPTRTTGTVDAWLNPSILTGGWIDPTIPGLTRRAAAGGVNNCRDWVIGLYGGQLGALYRPLGGACTAVLQSPLLVKVGTWYHVALTLDGTTARLYVNGNLEATGATAPNYNLEESFLIGHASCPQCVGDNFGGLVDEVEVFDSALTQAEIQSIYTAGSAGKCKRDAAPNTPPFITTLPPSLAVAQLPYRYIIRAQDAEAQTLSFALGATAPAGMSLNTQLSAVNSSVLEWTPKLSQIGTHPIDIIVRDAAGGVTHQTFDLEVVASAVNQAPAFTSTPRTKARIGWPYVYLAEATDVNGDPVSFTLVNGPASMTFDPSSSSPANARVLSWTPTAEDIGSHSISIRASDGRGGTADQSFSLVVGSSIDNQPPQIVSNPLLQATAGQLYAYDLRAIDPDDDDVTWRLVSGPMGVSLDPGSGALRWMSTLDQLGSNSVTVEATDTAQASATQTWTINVGCVNRPPRITSAPPVVAQTGNLYIYFPRASDPDGDRLTWTLAANPTGMTIDNSTGLIRWTPTATQTGATLVTLRISDLRGGTDSQTYTLTATDVRANKPPVIVSIPTRGVTAQRPYTYAVRATDTDGDTLMLSLLAAPTSATVTTTTSVPGQVDGIINWTPITTPADPQEFIVIAKDPTDASAAQRFFVTVRANSPPIITSTPPTNAVPNITSRYDVFVTDADGDALSYSLTQPPSGMNIDAMGRIVWIPTAEQLGPHDVAVTVSDGFGGIATQSYNITVGADTTPPVVSVGVAYNLVDAQGNRFVQTGTQIALTVDASDNAGVTERELRLDGIAQPLNENGGTVAMFPNAGFVQAIAKARDASVNEGEVTVNIPVVDPNAASTVAITIQSPASFDTITHPVNIVGSITSQTALSHYTVEFAELNSKTSIEGALQDSSLDYQLITRVNLPPNTLSVPNAVLGKFDPTLLHNGTYLVRVTASNINAKGRQEGVVLNVTGNLKLGEFHLEFTDLSIPLVGIPIQIKRIYDTRDSKRTGDFGYGWTLALQNARILEAGKKSFAGVNGVGFSFTTKTRVYLTAPDGRRVGFNFTPELAAVGFFGAFYRPAFTADPGGYDKLEVVPSPAAYQINGEGTFVTGFGLVGCDPKAYRLTTRDNLIYDYDENFGLQKVADLNGNTITFSSDGIRHSSGVEIKFVRDAQGRITEIIDPEQKSIKYQYNTVGDLISVTERTNLATQFSYHPQRAHYLAEITDPLGRQAVRTEYDDRGRIKAVIDALGKRQEQDFVPEQFTGTLTDARGNVTQITYNDRGNVTEERKPTDDDPAHDSITRYEYKDPANPDKETKITDANRHARSFTYDANGNKTSITDALNKATNIAYNSLNKPTLVTNALGQKLSLSYDAKGQLFEVVNNAGDRTTATRDGQGRITSVKDKAGNVTMFDHTDGCFCGKPGKIINPDGSFRRYEYNSLGQTTLEVNELGAETRFFYDDEGRLTATEDPKHHRTTFTYRGTVQETKIDPLLRVTRYEYDDKDQQTKITDAESGVVQFEYDGNGNRTKVVDPVNNATTFVYDKANRVKEEINTFGHKRLYAYDSAGNRTEAIDRNGRRRTFEYDAMNRMTKEHWWDGANIVRTIEYAFNALGVQTLAADPAARFDYIYDSLNRLQRVAQSATADQPDFTLAYTHDPLGQVTSVTDNWGVQVGSSYDNRNRLAMRTWQGPGIDPARVDFTYDFAGNRTGLDRYADLDSTQRVGHETQDFALDGVLQSITHLGPTNDVIARYDYSRDAAHQITQWTINNQLSTFTYDLTGQLTSANHAVQPSETYQYDLNGNRKGVQPSGNYSVGTDNQIRSDGTNNYAYDAEGSMISRSNNVTGVLTKYSFDHRNRLVSVQDFNSSGVMTQTVAFVYDAMNRRLTKTVNGQVTRFLHNQDDSWADLDNTNAVTARYLHAAKIDELLARQRMNDGRSWYLTDHLGTVRDVANTQGALLAHVDYSNFGKLRSVSNPPGIDRFLFTGREFDSETGLYFYRARYYDPDIGRFINEDPMAFVTTESNLYRYAGNKPIIFADPTGLGLIEDFNNLRTLIITRAGAKKIGLCVARIVYEIAWSFVPGPVISGVAGEAIGLLLDKAGITCKIIPSLPGPPFPPLPGPPGGPFGPPDPTDVPHPPPGLFK